MDKKEELILNFINSELNEVPDTANEKLYVDNQKLNTRYEFDELKKYIDVFLNERTSNRFIILPGLRGVGKSTILFQLYDYLTKEKNILNKNILYFSCDELHNTLGCDIKKTIEIYLKNRFNASLRTLKEKVFILIDEAQYDKNWALSGKIIYDKSYNIFLVFTGSSAINLEYNADASRILIKRPVSPLNYRQHLKLKYNIELNNISNSLKKLIFTGNVDNAIKCEFKMNDILTNSKEYNSMDWNNYFKYDGFPIAYGKKSLREIRDNLVDISDMIISKDMAYIDNLTSYDEANANRILRFLARQHSGELTHENLTNYLTIKNINNILDFLEKTRLIFHCEDYGGAAGSVKKSWKYYFASCSIRYALAKKIGHPLIDTTDFEGLLIENLIASNLFNLLNRDGSFSLYYDSNIDFLIQNGLEYPIPIEVGRGVKKKSQIEYAIDNFNSEYGIIVANNTGSIEKVDNIIYVPLKTFALL